LRNLGLLFVLAVMLGACQSGSSAQKAPSPEVQRQYEAAFQDMLNQPGNLDVALKYAALANKAGDLEGAIGTYEGILLIDSNLPQVRLELGILYFRLKSYDAARSYLESALQSPELAADARKPAEQLLAKMPKQSKTRRT
jgi:tetratricopeptide (TPR) repeat protein